MMGGKKVRKKGERKGKVRKENEGGRGRKK